MASADNDEVYHHLLFPLPYRILALVGFGILGWATNLQGLDVFGIDVVSAMDLRTHSSYNKTVMPVHHSHAFNHTRVMDLYKSVYRILTAYSSLCFLSWFFYRLVTREDVSLVDSYGYVPVITIVSVLLILFCPFNILLKQERDKFVLSVKRCMFPRPNGPIYFSDIILADIGTSFARMLGDIWQSLLMLKPGNSILIPPVEDNWLRWVLPAIISLPFLFRFRQCLIEYNLPENNSKRPFFNALKYATSFPVIFLSAAQRLVVGDLVRVQGSETTGEAWHGEHPLFRLWLLAAVINSIYSFWWDVTNDWGLDLLKFEPSKNHERRISSPPGFPRLHSGTPLISGRTSPVPSSDDDDDSPFHLNDAVKYRRRQSCYGLRPALLYPRGVYPVLVFLNLLLRMTWSVKLSAHVNSVRDGHLAFFWLEVAEIVRRWLWVFLRVEWEVIKKDQEGFLTNHFETRSEDEAEYEMTPVPPDSPSALLL